MSLVLRRARAARSLLLAAAGVTLIATALLTSLVAYSREVVASGTRGAVASASAEERSVLVRGSAGSTAAELSRRDAVLRSQLAGGIGGRPATVSAAGYATGRELSGPTGDAVPDSGGAVFGSVVFLEGLTRHADLTEGEWPKPGAAEPQTVLAESVAAILKAGPGDSIPITDRLTSRSSRLTVVGVWRPRDPSDPYWLLTPDVATGVAPQSATYGPLVVDRADFTARFARNASAGWLVVPDLTGAGPAEVNRLAGSATALGTTLPQTVGLGSSGLVTTRAGTLSERLLRADLVGRSALVTPLLLVVVLSGLALVLVAALLVEHRRSESALLRARGAARRQLAGLAAREALMVVVPAAVVAPLVAVRAQGGTWPDGLLWSVALVAAAGCAVAITVPALRDGGTYVAEMAGRSRPSRRSLAQRVGIDVALVALAVLGWFQLRQYASPLAGRDPGGTAGIDPFLASAPTLGVLAGATVALRLLPPASRLAERWVDRRSWVGTVLGMWQAGRRPHAGPVLLLALAVATGTVAWCLAGSSARSVVDQADHRTGADLRLVETGGTAPPGRSGQLTALPGAASVLPAWRETLPAGPSGETAELLAVDAAAASEVLRVRPDLADGDPAGALRSLAAQRLTAPEMDLPAGTTRLTGTITGDRSQTVAVLSGAGGNTVRVALGGTGRFSVDLPRTGGPLRLAGFSVISFGQARQPARWQLSGLGGDTGPLSLDALPWQITGRAEVDQPVRVSGDVLTARVAISENREAQFVVAAPAPPGRVPLLATPQALTALRLEVGKQTALRIGGGEVGVVVVGTIAAVPTTGEPAALLADLPSLSTVLLHTEGVARTPREWFVETGGNAHPATARAAARLGGLEVLDRRAIAAESAGDAYGAGARTALFAAALGAILLAAAGITVDVRATARRRITELAVLHTLGAGSRLLARSLMIEQAFLAGVGVAVGLVVGIGVAATMAPLLILTPSADRPVPEPLLAIDWLRVGGTALVLLVLALGLSALVGTTLRRRLAVAQLRIGADR